MRFGSPFASGRACEVLRKIGLQSGDGPWQAAGVATKSKPNKNPAAVALGRLGGLKGGVARAKKLSEVERKLSARKAAIARWSKIKKTDEV